MAVERMFPASSEGSFQVLLGIPQGFLACRFFLGFLWGAATEERMYEASSDGRGLHHNESLLSDTEDGYLSPLEELLPDEDPTTSYGQVRPWDIGFWRVWLGVRVCEEMLSEETHIYLGHIYSWIISIV